MVTLGAAIRAVAKQLQDAGVDTPDLDARLLIAHALGLSRVDLITRAPQVWTAEDAAKIAPLIARRAAREPVSRILGQRDFWGQSYALTDATLDPRPDSETLIEAILAERPDTTQPFRVLDIGTGSGCLLLTLLAEYPAATGIGTDINPAAILAATANAAALSLTPRAQFQETRWADGIPGPFDLIISNPPYIPSRDIEGLEPEVKDHDPYLALNGGKDGLDAYRALADLTPPLLAPDGLVILEIGIGQTDDVTRLFTAAGFTLQACRKDLGRIDRALLFRKS
jgi:release factor glutamine methyltransferase